MFVISRSIVTMDQYLRGRAFSGLLLCNSASLRMSDEADPAGEFAPLKVWVAYPSDWASPRESRFEVADGEDLAGDDFAYLAKCYPAEKLALVVIGIAGQCMFLKCMVSEAQPVRRAGALLIRVQCQMIERLEGDGLDPAEMSSALAG